MAQAGLFDDLAPSPGALPDGLVYQDGFLSAAEETALIALMARLPLQEARYKSYTARRRVVSYGSRFDYDANELLPSGELIEELHPLRARMAQWAGVAPEALAHVLVAEYLPGTPLGWHRDVPDFEEIFGVSMGGTALLRLRPYPPVRPKREDIIKLPVQPRSIYAMRGTARWGWQHSVAPVDATRWSITFRTLRR
jgi:alkylated DNA repair dioxygenase AlkB